MSRFPGQRCLEHDKTIKILSKTVSGLRGLLFTRFPGDLKPPMEAYLHASGHVVNQNPVTKSGLKQRLVVMFWAQK